MHTNGILSRQSKLCRNIILAANFKLPPYISHNITVILGAGIATTITRIALTRGLLLIVMTFRIKARVTGKANNFMKVQLHASLSAKSSEALLLARAIPISDIDNGVVMFDKKVTGVAITEGKGILPK